MHYIHQFHSMQSQCLKILYIHGFMYFGSFYFWKFFQKMKKKHPLTYIEATIGTCVGYFIPVNAFEIFPDAGSGLSKQIVYQPEKLSTIHYYF